MQQKNREDILPTEQKTAEAPSAHPADSLAHTVKEKAQEGTENVKGGAGQVVKGVQKEVAVARRPWYRAIRWGYVLLMLYAIQLSLFALLAWWVHFNPVNGLDVFITRELQENKAAWFSSLMYAVSYIGNNFVLSTGLIVLAAVLFWIARLRLEAVAVVFISATSALLNGLIKVLVARPRPSAPLVEVLQVAGGQSFPSGHVMAYVAFWGLLFSFGVILFHGNRWWRVALLIVPALMVILVGPSRIYLGDHWASDVLGAYLFGGLWLGIWLWVYLKLKERGVLAPGWSYRRRKHGAEPGHKAGNGS
jgi:membrane-associated phospholipid phosphatase